MQASIAPGNIVALKKHPFGAKRFFINTGGNHAPFWAEICAGIVKRRFSSKETVRPYIDMLGNTHSWFLDTRVQTRAFHGTRLLTDEVQNEIFIKRLQVPENRVVQFLELYQNMPQTQSDTFGNCWLGEAFVTVETAPFEASAAQENFIFTLSVQRAMRRGIAELNSSGGLSFTSL